MTSASEVASLNDSYHTWSGKPLEKDMLEEIGKLVRYNIQSRNESDQLDQKELFVKVFESLPPTQVNSRQDQWMGFSLTT